MKILYVTSEVTPFAASGGLGDVLGALPRTVAERDGYECAVILPLYSQIKPEYRQMMKKVDEFYFYLGYRSLYCGIWQIEKDGVTYFFVDNEYYFKRDKMYGQYDDGERFAYFSRAVIEVMAREIFLPDIMHANDWQSACAVEYLKLKYASHPKLSAVKAVYTIHNIEYQGKYDMAILENVFDFDYSFKNVFEFDGCINLMKAAIVSCDVLTTVSQNYAKELREPFFAFGLHNIIRENSYKMCGIINGIDTVYFSPENGDDIEYTYNADTFIEGKAKNKLALQRELGLEENADIPMAVMITRLTAGKGIDLVIHILDELLEQNMQFVMLGTGEYSYEEILSRICERHGDKARALIKFDRVISKHMYAAADIFIMPSKSEPCGLAQMTACRYGTIPVVRAVGGLADSIVNYGLDGSNGFVFANFNAHELLFRIKDALSLYGVKDEWNALVRRAMTTDFTWERSAQKYIEMYEKIN